MEKNVKSGIWHSSLIKGYLKLVDYMNMILKIVGGIILVAMVLSVFLSVISRAAANFSISWVEELVTFGMAWIAAIGTALAVRGGDLTNLELLLMKLPKHVQRIINLLTCVLSLVLFIFMLYSGFKMAAIAKLQSAPTIPGLSMLWVYIAVPMGIVAMWFNTIARMIEIAGKEEDT